MSRADELRAQQETELAVVTLEDELLAAKAAGADGPDYRDLKLRLREARQRFRETREHAAAAPATVETAAEVGA